MSTHPGAVWRRFDLQCHTPRDLHWQGSPGLPGGTAPFEQARQAWAEEFVAAALAKALSVVAVTDHHDVTMLPYIRAAVAATDGQLSVFPGVEVTCKDAVQCLALFEPDMPHAELDGFLTKLSAIARNPSDHAKISQVSHCGLDIADLFAFVAKDPVLASKTLLLPHFGNASAHKSLNAEGFAPRAKALPIDAVYIECAQGELEESTLDKLHGKSLEWGSRRLAVIPTGDNRRADWERLGRHECWVRTGEHSLEALRQAFLAEEARICHSRPAVPSDRVIEMEVMSILTGEAPFRLTFNEGFNALIGGRGSGKSAMLEYLAFGLGKADADRDLVDGKARRGRERERALINETIGADGWVRVTIERSGVREIWKRTGAKPEEVLANVEGAVEALTVAAAQARFPARTFHQKELSTTMVDPESAAENITLIAAAEAVDERRRLDHEVSNAKRAMETALMNVAAYWQSEVDLSTADAGVSDLERRIAAVKARLETEGVTGGDIAILEDARCFDRGRNYLSELQTAIAARQAEVSKVPAWRPPEFIGTDVEALPFVSLSGLAAELTAVLAEERRRLDVIAGALDGLERSRAAAKDGFEAERAAFAARYDEYKTRQAAHSVLISESEQLAASLKGALTAQAQARADKEAKESAVMAYGDARATLATLVARRLKLLKESADQIAEKSDGALKARPSRDRKPSECVSALCALLEKTGVRDAAERCNDWVEAAFAKDAEQDWESLCNELIGIYRAKIMTGSPAEPPTAVGAAIREIYFNGVGGMTANQVSKMYDNLSDKTIGAVLSSTPRDGIVLTYMSDGQPIRFEQASPGQQASALLRLLLRQSVGTLIIDQPEDDLDNRVMMDIVGLIRRSKISCQLIFSTHNPNLVVNGDADKVVVMRATVPEDRAGPAAARIRTEVDGAIETPAVRDEITRIMEGGMEAFALRSRKYGA